MDAKVSCESLSKNIKVKLEVHHVDLRKVSLSKEEISFSDFVLLLRKIFSDILHSESDLSIKYEDEDGDLITITNSSDLKLALKSRKVFQVTSLAARKESRTVSCSTSSKGLEPNVDLRRQIDEIKLQLEMETSKRTNLEKEGRRWKEKQREMMKEMKKGNIAKDEIIARLNLEKNGGVKLSLGTLEKDQQNVNPSTVASTTRALSNGLTINSLDDSCLLRIFSYIPFRALFQVEQVCLRWRSLVQICVKDLFIERKQSITEFIEDCQYAIGRGDVRLINKIIKLIGSKIVKLDEKFFELLKPEMTYETAVAIGKYCPNLEDFYFSGKFDNNFCLTSIIDWCRKIRKLHINCYTSDHYEKHDADERLKWIFTKLNINLVELKLRGNITGAGEFFKYLPNSLEKLTSEWYITQDIFELVSTRCRNLQVLKVNSEISAKTFHNIMENCPHIVEMNISIRCCKTCICSKEGFTNLTKLKSILFTLTPEICAGKLLESVAHSKKLVKLLYPGNYGNDTSWQWFMKLISECKSLEEVSVPHFDPMKNDNLDMFIKAIETRQSPIKVISKTEVNEFIFLKLKSLNCEWIYDTTCTYNDKYYSWI